MTETERRELAQWMYEVILRWSLLYEYFKKKKHGYFFIYRPASMIHVIGVNPLLIEPIL